MALAEPFGETRAGEKVSRVRIEGGGLSASLLTYGAVVQDLRLRGHHAPLVLGFDEIGHYLDHSPYFGAIVGRCANRIAGGKFTIDGERFLIEANDRGHALHGGPVGLDRRVWRLADAGADFATFTIVDPAGETGFPANLEIACTYRLKSSGTLSVELEARCDEPTLCNLAHHSYFNLDDGGRGDILDHRMTIAALAYTPVDEDSIPTGEVLPVEGTEFDFVVPRTVRLSADSPASYDHNFCVASARGGVRRIAWVQGARSGVEMEVWSGEPGLQFFSGGFSPPPVPGLDGISYRTFAGFCLEPQVWPDSPNRPYFPQALLRPGETYLQTTEFRFRLPQDF